MVILSGRVHAVSISEAKGTQKHNVEAASLIANHGIETDAHAGPWHRQVSLLALESIEVMRQMGADADPGDFAENITTRGINLLLLKPGDRISIADSILEITQIGKECHSHCAIFAQVGDCVMPREGIFAQVLRGGLIRPGDPINLLAESNGVPAARSFDA
ncbi:MOSC domain-containing protein [candidate division KSB1 bacterium]|nr:MOSC domain-containing protein [candidate division KSB1 bacterium]